ncbi:MAG: hypothetical protein MUF83_10295 [Acidimicrobiales bacterium]|jgi:hypothetical protein|nr:hypothetical protein [Acidimicrobiales bacterium]
MKAVRERDVVFGTELLDDTLSWRRDRRRARASAPSKAARREAIAGRAVHAARHAAERRAGLVPRGGPAIPDLRSRHSRCSVLSYRSVASVASALSAGSAGSLASLLSVGSIASVGSAGSILSIGSSGSILSIGSAGGLLTVGRAGARGRRTPDGTTMAEVHAFERLGSLLALAAFVAAAAGR